MVMMFRSTLLLCTFAALGSAQLRDVQSVYFLPMAGSLDQYLASKLVEMHLFQVTTDPQRADAIFVDRIGEGLEAKMAELFPEQVKKPPKDEERDPNDKDAKEKDKDKKLDFGAANPVRTSNFARGRGTLYLVDRKTHAVLWSAYSPSKTNRMPDIHKNAEAIAKRIATAMKDLKPAN